MLPDSDKHFGPDLPLLFELNEIKFGQMHQIRFRLELRPRPIWGSLQRSHRPPSWIYGAYF